MRFLNKGNPRNLAPLRVPAHLAELADHKTRCTETHLTYDRAAVDGRHTVRATEVAEIVWCEAFAAGAAHALATMSTQYILVTAEEREAMLAAVTETDADLGKIRAANS